MVVGQTIQNLITAAVGLLILAGVIVGTSAFGNSLKKVGTRAGCNATHVFTCGLNDAGYNMTKNIEAMTNQFGSQLGTVGIMFGVGLIIAAIAVLGVGMLKQS